MILVPKERACSKLFDGDKNWYIFLVLLPIVKERKSVLELRASPVLLQRENVTVSNLITVDCKILDMQDSKRAD